MCTYLYMHVYYYTGTDVKLFGKSMYVDQLTVVSMFLRATDWQSLTSGSAHIPDWSHNLYASPVRSHHSHVTDDITPCTPHIVHNHSPTVSFSSVEHLCTSYTQGGVLDQLMSGDEVVSTGHDCATVAACANEADLI